MSEPKSRFKSSLTASIIGGLLALVLSTIFLPKAMVWYFEPPVNPGCSCAASIERAFDLFRGIQLASLFIGAIFGFLLALRWTKKSGPKNDACTPS